jgi:hypothetical protein
MNDPAFPIRCYYIDSALSTAELAEVEEMLQRQVELVRVPYVLPDTSGIITESTARAEEDAAAKALRRVAIEKDSGRRCLFVIPHDLRWQHAFLSAIHRITGFFPFTIQTAAHRDHLGVPGELRILDMQKAME